MLYNLEKYLEIWKMYSSKLKEIRKRRGISLYRISRDLDLNWSTVSNLEKGRTDMIKLSFLRKICEYFDITLNDLIEFDMEKKDRMIS